MSARSSVRWLAYFVAASLLAVVSTLVVDAQRAGAQTTSTIDQTLLDPADSVVSIGELVEYRIRIELSEGTAALTLTNVMPTLASSDGVVSFQGGSVVSVGPGISTALTVGSAPSATDQIGFDGLDDTVVFDFGTVTVETPSADANVIVVEVVGLVVDIADNSGGDSLTNTATLAFGAETLSDTETVSIAEPKLTLDKESDLRAVAPGATIPYTVTLGHTFDSGAPAHDITVSDILADANLLLVPGSVTAMIVGANGSPDPVVSAPGSVAVSLGTLNPGDQLVITYSAELSGTAGDASSFFNTATADYDSLSGTGGRADSAVDRYRIATVAALFKAVESTTFAETEAEQGDPLLTDVNIGEEVSFTYQIFLPELEVDGLVFTDRMPSTFNFSRAEVVEVGSDLTLQDVTQVTGGGLVGAGGTSVISESNGVVTINFGAVTNNLVDDDVDNNERIVIRVTGSVGAVPANVAGMQLTNDAQIELFILNPDETAAEFELADQRTLDIVEPDLDIDKTVTPTNADAGDVVTYTIHVAHDPTSTGPAYDIVITDPLLASLTLVNSSVRATTGVITTGGATGDSSVRVDIPALDFGQSATITFDATLADTALFNSAQTNTATLVYDSHPDANAAGERMYGPETDDATVSTPSPTITKTVDASSVNETAGSSLVVGEVVTFRTTIDMPEGSSPMTLIDSLPASGALSYHDARIVSQTSNVSFSAAPTVATAGTVTTFDFNTVTVAGATPTVGGQIVVEVDALVEDVAAVINGAAFANSADLNFNGGLAEAEATVSIFEPALTIAKSAPAAAFLGAPVDYSLTVNHTGASTAAAFDLVVADPLSDPNLMLDTGSVTATVAGVALDPSAITITTAGGQQGFAVRVDALLLGQTLAISYQAQFAADAPPSTTFVNTATLAFDSVGVADQVPGAPGRSGAATASASTVSAAPAIEKPIDRRAVPVADEHVPVADEETLLAAIVARATADDPTPPPVALAEPAPIPTRPPLAITGTTVTSTLGFGSLLAAVGFSCLGFARRRRTTPGGS